MTINVVNPIDLQKEVKSLPRRLHVLCATLRKILKVSIRKKKINHISNQSVERIKEILVNDRKPELELETDSLEYDLSNTETPEDGQQIGCVKLRNLISCEMRLFQLQLCMLSRMILVIQAW